MAEPYLGDFKQSLTETFARDLDNTIEELALYSSEANMWKIENNILNSGGNLAMHIAGNLRHFIGKELGNSGYERNRDFEFEGKNVPRQEIINSLKAAKEEVIDALNNLSNEALNAPYPGKFRIQTSTQYMLVHLSIHLGWHLGQLNYHRRLLDV